MDSLVKLASWGAMALFAGFFAVVFWKLFTGGIPLNGLLEGDIRDRNSPDGVCTTPSAGRSQTLLITLYVAVWYLLQVIHNPTTFPKIPDAMVGVLAGSQIAYLGGKAQGLFLGRLRDLIP